MDISALLAVLDKFGFDKFLLLLLCIAVIKILKPLVSGWIAERKALIQHVQESKDHLEKLSFNHMEHLQIGLDEIKKDINESQKEISNNFNELKNNQNITNLKLDQINNTLEQGFNNLKDDIKE